MSERVSYNVLELEWGRCEGEMVAEGKSQTEASQGATWVA